MPKAFEDLQMHLNEPSFLSMSMDGENLFLYLAISKQAFSSALVRKDNGVQRAVYRVSKILSLAE